MVAATVVITHIVELILVVDDEDYGDGGDFDFVQEKIMGKLGSRRMIKIFIAPPFLAARVLVALLITLDSWSAFMRRRFGC